MKPNHSRPLRRPWPSMIRCAGRSTAIGAKITVASLWLSASYSAFAAVLTPLGDLPGGSFFSLATEANIDGSVVVGNGNADSASTAFRWTASSGMVAIGNSFTYAYGVSGDGSIVVGTNGLGGAGTHAFRWTASSGIVNLGDLPGGDFISGANAVSADGSVVVGFSNAAAGNEAFRWTASGGMVGLGELPGGNSNSVANAVSATGTVIAGSSASGPGVEAFRWTQSGMVGLGDLPGGIFQSIAYSMSSDGSVIAGRGASSSGNEAFRWTAADGMLGLGDLPEGTFSSVANGISADGSVVVGNGTTAAGSEAFRWTAGDGMLRLWDVLLTQGVHPAADGWTVLTTANGVSGDGNAIVGYGMRNGNQEAFVAVIPEPSSLSLLLTGGLVLARRSRAGKTRL